MKEIVQYYARCNRKINNDMLGIISANVVDPMHYALRGYFFKTLGMLLEHIYIADRVWLQTFINVNSYGIDAEKEMGATPSYGEEVFKNFEGYKSAREKLDNIIIEYMDKVKEDFFATKVVRINKKGERMEKEAWKAIIHFFNHQTHHRGQISNILDEMNIENDYSNMIRIE
jgi:uncharacterized damage-inducible protein DinB